MPAAGTDSQTAFAWHALKRHCAGCLSGKGGSHELAARSRCAALVVNHLRLMKEHCTGESPLSFGVIPSCDMPAAGSDEQPSFAWHRRQLHCELRAPMNSLLSRGTGAGATAMALSREKGKHAS